MIEEHDELGAGAGRHEELYFVARGHAVFEVGRGKRSMRRPARSYSSRIRSSAPRRHRIQGRGGPSSSSSAASPGKAFSPSPWEAWLEATPHLEAGEPDRGIQVFERTLAAHPGNPNVLYNLACFESLAGRMEAALVHLGEAVECRPAHQRVGQTDSDFDAIRSDPRFPAAG